MDSNQGQQFILLPPSSHSDKQSRELLPSLVPGSTAAAQCEIMDLNSREIIISNTEATFPCEMPDQQPVDAMPSLWPTSQQEYDDQQWMFQRQRSFGEVSFQTHKTVQANSVCTRTDTQIQNDALRPESSDGDDFASDSLRTVTNEPVEWRTPSDVNCMPQLHYSMSISCIPLCHRQFGTPLGGPHFSSASSQYTAVQLPAVTPAHVIQVKDEPYVSQTEELRLDHESSNVEIDNCYANIKIENEARDSVTPPADVSERLLKCHSCQRTFTKVSYLKQHNKATHNGVRPFKCVKCGKRFSCNDTYHKHLEKHTGDKPHKCSVCPKQFNYIIDLKRHVFLHTGQKPYVCGTCGKGFVRKDHMMNHNKVHSRVSQSVV